NLFQATHKFDRAQSLAFAVRRSKSPQIENWIPYDLPRSMKSDVAAAVAFEQLDPTFRKELRRSDDVSSSRVASQRDDGGMFEQQQNVADLLRLTQIHQLLLQPQSLGVANGSELVDRNQIEFARCSRWLSSGSTAPAALRIASAAEE